MTCANICYLVILSSCQGDTRVKEDERPWQVLRRETIYDSPWVRLHRDDVRLRDPSQWRTYWTQS